MRHIIFGKTSKASNVLLFMLLLVEETNRYYHQHFGLFEGQALLLDMATQEVYLVLSGTEIKEIVQI
jgi:hypothetical protein